MKTCTKCGLEKELSDFSNYKYKGEPRKRASCNSCRNEQQKSRYASNPDVHRAYLYKQKYGITLEEYDEMLAEQEGCCLICKRDTPNGQGRFVVDHNHTTGEIRGLLCSTCNTGLGNFMDNPDFLLSAYNYIKERGHYG